MAITTYSELQTAVASRLQRDDLSGLIPDFITFAEKRLNRELRVSGLEKRATTDTVAGTSYYEFPADYASVRHVKLNTDPVRVLEYLSPEVADIYFSSTATAKPYAYSVVGNEFRLYDTPDGAYELEISYYSNPTALSDSNTSNWYLTNVPDLLLFASLIYAASHMRDQNRLTEYSEIYNQLKQEIEQADLNDKWSGSNMRTRIA